MQLEEAKVSLIPTFPSPPPLPPRPRYAALCPYNWSPVLAHFFKPISTSDERDDYREASEILGVSQ